MKRLLCLMLLFLLFLPGCEAQEKEEFVEPVNFYYLKTDVTYFSAEGVIGCEIREAEGYQQDYEKLLKLFLRGPESGELKRVFPKNVELVRLELTETGATVVLSDTAARLTGLDLTIACTCLTATVCDMTGVETVTIRTKTQLLDGNKAITMSRDQILLLDDSQANISD